MTWHSLTEIIWRSIWVVIQLSKKTEKEYQKYQENRTKLIDWIAANDIESMIKQNKISKTLTTH